MRIGGRRHKYSINKICNRLADTMQLSMQNAFSLRSIFLSRALSPVLPLSIRFTRVDKRCCIITRCEEDIEYIPPRYRRTIFALAETMRPIRRKVARSRHTAGENQRLKTLRSKRKRGCYCCTHRCIPVVYSRPEKSESWLVDSQVCRQWPDAFIN